LLGSRFFICRRLVSKLLQLSFDLIGHGIGIIACLDFFASPAVFIRMRLCVADHAIDFFFRELSRAGNLDRLLFPCVLVASSCCQDV